MSSAESQAVLGSLRSEACVCGKRLMGAAAGVGSELAPRFRHDPCIHKEEHCSCCMQAERPGSGSSRAERQRQRRRHAVHSARLPNASGERRVSISSFHIACRIRSIIHLGSRGRQAHHADDRRCAQPTANPARHFRH